MTETVSDPTKSLTPYKVAIVGLVAGLLIVSAIGVSLAFSRSTLSQAAASQSNSQPILVMGEVKSTGANTGATQIIFSGPGNPISLGVGYAESPGTQGLYGGTLFTHYNAYLTNGAIYNVQVVYAGTFSWQGGAVTVGTLIVAGSGGTMTKDFTAITPDSWVGVSGIIVLNGNQTVINPRPLSIAWMSETLGGVALHRDNPSDHGGGFTALVTKNNGYSLNVPNHDRFDLAISWTTSAGVTGTCYVATMIGFGVVTVAVEVGNGQAYYTYNPTCNVSGPF